MDNSKNTTPIVPLSVVAMFSMQNMYTYARALANFIHQIDESSPLLKVIKEYDPNGSPLVYCTPQIKEVDIKPYIMGEEEWQKIWEKTTFYTVVEDRNPNLSQEKGSPPKEVEYIRFPPPWEQFNGRNGPLKRQSSVRGAISYLLNREEIEEKRKQIYLNWIKAAYNKLFST